MKYRKQFERETGKEATYQSYMGRGGEKFGNDYVIWLERKLKKIENLCHDVEELKDGYHDTEAQLRDEILTDIVKVID